MAVYTKEYESQPEAILTNVIICPAVDLSANVAVPVHCQVENVLWDTGATNTLISQEVVNALGLQPKNKALISSAGGDVESWTYLVHVILPTGTAELNVQALLNDNSDYDVVIGMDIINLKSATTRLYDTEAKIICIVSKKGAQCIECHHKDI